MTDFPPEVQYKTLLLEKARAAAHTRLSPQLAHDVKLEVYRDLVVRDLVVTLSTHVLQHRLADTYARETFERDVEFYEKADVPGERWRFWPAVVVAVSFTGLAIAFGSLLTMLAVMAFTLAAVLAWSRTPDFVGMHFKRKVTGTVTIPVRNYAAFPENATIYPPELGRVVKIQQLDSPLFYYES